MSIHLDVGREGAAAISVAGSVACSLDRHHVIGVQGGVRPRLWLDSAHRCAASGRSALVAPDLLRSMAAHRERRLSLITNERSRRLRTAAADHREVARLLTFNILLTMIKY